MPIRLCLPDAPPRSLRWTTHHPASRRGLGVLIYKHSSEVLDGAGFRALRDGDGAWIETDREDRVRGALGLEAEESLAAPASRPPPSSSPLSAVSDPDQGATVMVRERVNPDAPLSNAAKQARRRARTAEAGGKTVVVQLSPQAVEGLARIREALSLGSDRAAIEAAIEALQRTLPAS